MGLILTQAQCGSDEPKEQHESKWNFRRNCCVWLTAWPDSDLIGTKRTLIAAVCDASIGHSGHERPLRTFEDTLANELMPFETVFRKWYTRTVRKFTLKLNIIHIISYIYMSNTHMYSFFKGTEYACAYRECAAQCGLRDPQRNHLRVQWIRASTLWVHLLLHL